jgi:AcrR family transcriptional regulator
MPLDDVLSLAYIEQSVKPDVQPFNRSFKMSRTASLAARQQHPEPQRPLADEDFGATKTKILDAAFRRLAADGYSALSVREIARDAGVNHALINYHFHSKDQLVIEVLDAANRRLLERQQSLYAGEGSFAEKWAQARRFYESDLASGFVRVQAELWSASLSNPELREKFLPRLLAWKKLVLGFVREVLAAFKSHGVVIPAPFTADVIACWISEFWLGMEFSQLLGVDEGKAQHAAALDAVQWLLELLDARAAAHPAKKRRTRG